MAKREVVARIGKTENNYAACVEGLDGFVCTADSFEDLKHEIEEGIRFHVEGLHEDGDPIPVPFNGDFVIVYKWEIESLLYYYHGIFTKSALERLTGINQTQLGHYAAGRSKPRREQARKIEEALHRLGDELCTVSI